MAYKLIFTSEAGEDTRNAAMYYDEQLPGLGKVFRSEIKRQLLSVKQNPYTRAIRYNNVRFAVTNRFPYAIHYTIDGQTIIVHAIMSSYRDPIEHWRQ